jgi:hypothetical protein
MNMSNDRYADFREALSRKDTSLNSSGLKKEPQNNRKDWSHWDNPPSPSKKKQVVEAVLPEADPAVLEWLDTL